MTRQSQPRDGCRSATGARSVAGKGPGGRKRPGTAAGAAGPDAERSRLAEAKQGTARWYRWGSYLSDRQWGTVREDYSALGDAWDYFPHDHARSRAYRWGEDGLLGIADDQARLCFGVALWNGADEFFYDTLHLETGEYLPLRVRSLVGLMPLLAVETLEPDLLDRLPEFKRRMRWFLANRPQLASLVASWEEPGMGERRLQALVHGHRMKALLRRMLDPEEFLSDHGIRALSRYHRDQPYVLEIGGTTSRVDYEPAESRSGLFGGNSNWRGPVWFPINYLLIEALQKFHHYYGPEFQVECPAGSGSLASLGEVAADLSRRLESIFLEDEMGRRPVFGSDERVQCDPNWRDHVLFYEYFNGDTGAGLGASHQTGWTALVAKLLEQTGRARAAAGTER